MHDEPDGRRSPGVATFAGCKIDKVGTGYTLTATGGRSDIGDHAPFNITVGAATKLAFTTQPATGRAGRVRGSRW